MAVTSYYVVTAVRMEVKMSFPLRKMLVSFLATMTRNTVTRNH